MEYSLYGTAYKFSKKFFTGWVIVSLLWAFFAFFGVTVFPIIEGRHLLLSWAKDLFGKNGKAQRSDEFDRHQHGQQHGGVSQNIEEKGIAGGTPRSVGEESD